MHEQLARWLIIFIKLRHAANYYRRSLLLIAPFATALDTLLHCCVLSQVLNAALNEQ
jgi:hypothetical protein